MSSSTTATKFGTTRGNNEASSGGQSSVYKVVMTPIIFVSFLFSLALIDLRYTFRRSKTHSHARTTDRNNSSRLPTWLHGLVFRPVQGRDGNGTTATKARAGDGYYHSKQKKLAEMEMADAFEIRGVVVAVSIAACAAGTWAAWAFGSFAWAVGKESVKMGVEFVTAKLEEVRNRAES